MGNLDRNLIRIDVRWDNEDNVRNRFNSIIQMIKFNNQVPIEVLERFKLVKRLLEFSIYEYEFMDLALERAILTFEMALRIKYQRKTGDTKIICLKKLYEWAEKDGLKITHKNKLEALRQLRNNVCAHPKTNTIFGIMNLKSIVKIVEFINKIFEE